MKLSCEIRNFWVGEDGFQYAEETGRSVREINFEVSSEEPKILSWSYQHLVAVEQAYEAHILFAQLSL